MMLMPILLSSLLIGSAIRSEIQHVGRRSARAESPEPLAFNLYLVIGLLIVAALVGVLSPAMWLLSGSRRPLLSRRETSRRGADAGL